MGSDSEGLYNTALSPGVVLTRKRGAHQAPAEQRALSPCPPPSSLWAAWLDHKSIGQCACSPPGLSAQIAGPRGNISLFSASLYPTFHPLPPRVGGPGPISSVKGRSCHSLGQGYISCVQQKLLPAVGTHQLHRLLVQAHLPETTPSHAHGAWLLPGRRGSHAGLRASWGGRKPTLGSPWEVKLETWDPGTS